MHAGRGSRMNYRGGTAAVMVRALTRRASPEARPTAPLKPRFCMMGQYSFTMRPENSSMVSGFFFFLNRAPAGGTRVQAYRSPAKSVRKLLGCASPPSSSALCTGFEMCLSDRTGIDQGLTDLDSFPFVYLFDTLDQHNCSAAKRTCYGRPPVGGKALGPPFPPSPPDARAGIHIFLPSLEDAFLTLLTLHKTPHKGLDAALRVELALD